MSLIEEQIKKYYENYDEDKRLIKDKSHSIEFITTTSYLNKYILDKKKVLEVGAGTGRYSFYYLERGLDVTAFELSEKHIEIMKDKSNKIKASLNIQQGNALDLSRFENKVYDAVLCLGPMYHLTSENDRMGCISECLRVLKPGGIIAIAYISKFAHFVDMIRRNKEDINDNGLFETLETGVEYVDDKECFYFSSYDEIETLMKNNNLEKLVHIGTDGISDMLRSNVNDFSDDEFELWMKYHLSTCENTSLVGYSKHCLFVAKKK